MNTPTFATWPAESVAKLFHILESLDKRLDTIDAKLDINSTTATRKDAQYIASLPPSERKAKLKGMAHGK